MNPVILMYVYKFWIVDDQQIESISVLQEGWFGGSKSCFDLLYHICAMDGKHEAMI